MKRTWMLLVLVFLLAALPACSSTATPTPTPTTTTPAGAVVVRLQQSGGIAGINDDWAIYDDGLITLNGSENQRVAPEKVAALQQQLLDLGFNDLEASYLPADPCCDRFTYVITLHTGDQTHTVTTIDETPDAPPALWQSLQAILDLLASASE